MWRAIERDSSGRAASTQEINASFRVAGQLIQCPIDIGAEIKQGELIAALDPSTFQAEVDRLKAEVANPKATSEAELELDPKLFEEGWVTKSRLDTVNATASAARASVLASKRPCSALNWLSYTTLTAPFDGLVVETYVENFQEVLAKQPIARVVNTEQVEFWVSIPVPYIHDALHAGHHG